MRGWVGLKRMAVGAALPLPLQQRLDPILQQDGTSCMKSGRHMYAEWPVLPQASKAAHLHHTQQQSHGMQSRWPSYTHRQGRRLVCMSAPQHHRITPSCTEDTNIMHHHTASQPNNICGSVHAFRACKTCPHTTYLRVGFSSGDMACRVGGRIVSICQRRLRACQHKVLLEGAGSAPQLAGDATDGQAATGACKVQ